MEGIIHIRIDDRLIHGQVATQWTNDLGATRIMAINDEVATNPTLKTVLRMAAPPNVSTSIITRETAVTNIKAGKYTGQKVLVVVISDRSGIRYKDRECWKYVSKRKYGTFTSDYQCDTGRKRSI